MEALGHLPWVGGIGPVFLPPGYGPKARCWLLGMGEMQEATLAGNIYTYLYRAVEDKTATVEENPSTVPYSPQHQQRQQQ